MKPIDQERLGKIRSVAKSEITFIEFYQELLNELLEHIDYLTPFVRDCEHYRNLVIHLEDKVKALEDKIMEAKA